MEIGGKLIFITSKDARSVEQCVRPLMVKPQDDVSIGETCKLRFTPLHVILIQITTVVRQMEELKSVGLQA
jgi:hypothetical protein